MEITKPVTPFFEDKQLAGGEVAAPAQEAQPKPRRKVTPKPLVQVARELGNAKADYEKLQGQIKTHRAKAAEYEKKVPAVLERIKKAADALAAATK
jgi:predicted  nucleic acid-binding Zn-ribbon protein